MTLGGTEQVATAHCPNERTLDPQSAARQTHLCPSQPHYGLHPAMFSGNDSLVLVASVMYVCLRHVYVSVCLSVCLSMSVCIVFQMSVCGRSVWCWCTANKVQPSVHTERHQTIHCQEMIRCHLTHDNDIISALLSSALTVNDLLTDSDNL